jgi:PAS domain S-box-containing protein
MSPSEPLDALREANARLSTLIDNLGSAVMVEDGTRHLVYANRELCVLFGIAAEPQALIGCDCAEAITRAERFFADPAAFVARTDRLLARQRRVMGEELHLADDRVVEMDFMPIFVDGVSKGVLWQFRDVTERSEQFRLRTYADQLHNVLTTMPVILWACDASGTFTVFEGKEMELFGIEASARVGKSIYDLYTERPEVLGYFQQALKGETFSVRGTSNGRLMETIYAPILEAGRIIGVSGLSVDITDPHKMEMESAASPEAAQPSAMEGLILVVDDNVLNRRMLQDQLVWLGYQNVETARNGEDAIAVVKRSPRPYRLILMDCDMPVINGFDATRQLRLMEVGFDLHTPIVALTAQAMAGDRERCFEAGMDDYLAKPVSLADLKAAVKRWIPD